MNRKQGYSSHPFAALLLGIALVLGVAVTAQAAPASDDDLILNGDAFEGCVPRDAGTHDPAGYSPHMAACARNFFGSMLNHIDIGSLIIIWGNHDYAMWKHLAASCGVSTFTNLKIGRAHV